MSAEELTALEEAMVGEILLSLECKLRFAGIHFSPGILAVDAVDKHSDEWLVEKVPRLAKWRWTELRACMGDDILRSHVVNIFFPTSIEEEQWLSLENTQNEAFNSQLWKVLSSKEVGSGKLTSVATDKKSCDKILEAGNFIFF